MILYTIPIFSLLFTPALSIQCHTCASRNFLAGMIDSILRQFGTPNMIDMRGNCNNTAELCVSTSYCYKRVDSYRLLEGGFGHDAIYWDKRCDLPPGITVATQPGKCVEYDRVKMNGYEVRRRMCTCNDRDFCNTSIISSTISSIIILSFSLILFF